MQQILGARVSTESQPGVLEAAIDEYKHFLQQARSRDTLDQLTDREPRAAHVVGEHVDS